MLKKLSVVLLLSLTVACVNTPPNLSPVGKVDFQNIQIGKDLDLLRDVAVDAQNNNLLSLTTTRNIVKYHESALKTLNARSAGWVTTLSTGLNEVVKNLPPNESKLLNPTVTLLTTVINEATK